MLNIEKLIDNNSDLHYNLKFKDKSVIFEDKSGVFSGVTIRKIIGFINNLHSKFKTMNIPVIFSFGYVDIVDKLSFVIFECICYYLIKKHNHRVIIKWQPRKNIWTEGIFSSPLLLLSCNKRECEKKFPQKFFLDIYMKHFRRIINSDKIKDTNYLGSLYKDLDIFLNTFNIEKEYRDQIGEVIAELVGNACEHGSTDCLLDIDITSNHNKEIKSVLQEGYFYGINIVVLNFSDILLGDGIRNKLLSENINADRYEMVQKAYNYHKKYFNEKYKEVDFFNISAMQDKISGRIEYTESGGTGLTMLIKALQEKSDTESCYVLSGYRNILFIKEYLEYDSDKWLGFNKNKNFLADIPDENISTEGYIYFPGTAYNLNFIMKRGV